MSDSRFWSTVSRYCSELAPVVGPIFSAASDLAGAIDRASLPPASTTPTPVLPVPSELD
jgi:hypothetical protein